MRVKLTTFIQNYNREGIWPEFLLFVYYIHDSAGELLVPEGITPSSLWFGNEMVY